MTAFAAPSPSTPSHGGFLGTAVTGVTRANGTGGSGGGGVLDTRSKSGASALVAVLPCSWTWSSAVVVLLAASSLSDSCDLIEQLSRTIDNNEGSSFGVTGASTSCSSEDSANFSTGRSADDDAAGFVYICTSGGVEIL